MSCRATRQSPQPRGRIRIARTVRAETAMNVPLVQAGSASRLTAQGTVNASNEPLL